MDAAPVAQNETLFQSFEWHTSSSPPATHETHSQTSHWSRLTRLLPTLADLGFTSVWLPPGCKANNPDGNGYDIYDIWDLGEFDQKGARSTKWGSREELDELNHKAKACGINLIWDAVLSHKTAGDSTEECWAVEVDKEDRRFEICDPRKIEAWIRYDFPGREREDMKYSSMKWNAAHFSGTDWDQRKEKHAIYKLIDDPATSSKPLLQWRRSDLDTTHTPPPKNRFSSLLKRLSGRGGKKRVNGSVSKASSRSSRPPPKRPGKGWAEDVDDQNGNNDYLMFSNIDYAHPETREDVIRWGRWMVDEQGLHGFRLDAAQHISFGFIKEWIQEVNKASLAKTGKEAFIVGEVWTGEVARITKWLDTMQHADGGRKLHAFDAPLLYNFSRISEAITDSIAPGRSTHGSISGSSMLRPDLRTLLHHSLLDERPDAALTVVTNHDTQHGQTSYTPMHASLKPLFYAFTLLRQEGLPCVFFGDMFGTKGPQAEKPVGMVGDNAGELRNGSGGSSRSLLAELVMCRKLFAYGKQRDYWDSPRCIGWTRAGANSRPGCVVLLNIETPTPGRVAQSGKKMEIGRPGEVWIDVLQQSSDKVTIDDAGWGIFTMPNPGVSVFISENAEGVNRFPVKLDLATAS